MRLPRVEDFESRVRGPGLTSRAGAWLGLAFAVCFLTGVWSHLQYDPPAWAPIGPSPASLYRWTQGLHVATGIACVPLLLVKLWSVFPRFFLRPPLAPRELVLHLLERGSILLLVSTAIFQLVTGVLNIVQWYPWSFSFRVTHEAVGWIAIGSILVHVAVKLPVIRAAFTSDPGPDDGDDDETDRSDDDGPPTSAGPGRRAVLATALGASAVATVLTVGQSVPWLRRVSVFAVRDGSGPQGLPVNRTARAAGATEAAMDPGFRLELRHGDRSVTLTRADLEALPQRTHRLPIACVEGWSREATWTGVAVRDLLELVGAPPASAVRVRSMQTRGAFGRSGLPAVFVEDHRTLLALELEGEPLDLDHGYPCRIIAPNRPGVLQTKWVEALEVVV